jgi:hypothetical protein
MAVTGSGFGMAVLRETAPASAAKRETAREKSALNAKTSLAAVRKPAPKRGHADLPHIAGPDAQALLMAAQWRKVSCGTAACPIGFYANFLAKVRGKRRTG